ncbi:MAG: preprotein translocase subunit SecG [Gemmatimonadaceae bacterium]
MYALLLILLILDSIVLAVAVLMQSGKGGGLAASFGGASTSSDSFLGMRQTGNLLTKASWWCGGIFLFLAFLLAMMSLRSRVPESVLDQQFSQPGPVAPVPGTGTPVVPLEPVPAPAAPTPEP